MNDIIVFSEKWFKQPHVQKRLLHYLNHKDKYIKAFAHWSMGIPTDFDQAVILRILPHMFDCYKNNLYQVGVFYSGSPLAKSLRTKLFPIWAGMHLADWVLLDRWLPELSFQFSTLTVSPQAGGGGSNTTCDGYLYSGGGAYTSAHSGDSVAGSAYGKIDISNRMPSPGVYYINRGAFTFNTSALTASATLSIETYPRFNITTSSLSDSDSEYLAVTGVTLTNNNNVVAADWSGWGTTTYKTQALSGLSDGTYDLTLSNNTLISLTGITKIGLRMLGDINSTAPTGSNSIRIDAADSGTVPSLSIDYTLPATNNQQQQNII